MWKKEPLYRLLVLASWFTFLSVLLFSGKFRIYGRSGYGPLLAAGIIILLALVITEFHRVRDKSAVRLTSTSFLGFFLLFFPILVAVAVRPTGLSTFAAVNRGINTSLSSADANLLDVLKSQIESEEGFKKLNLKQFLALAGRQPEEIDGLQVAVEGFAYHDEAHLSNSFMLVRFLITCCAADATPLGVEVRSDETYVFPPDTWVRVQGTARIENGRPVIAQSSVIKVPKPSNVYLY